ncbi:mitochondrial import inner membrane translocase subunit TIM44-2 [Citrus sinensis]|nr:mitochondrial import inner membrane translocase subunit TIM44-2 [Citrus sinensis]
MASRKLVRDLFLSRQRPRFLQLTPLQGSSTRLRLVSANGYSSNRQFSVFKEFSKKIKGEAESNPEFKHSVKELKKKAEEIKGVKEELKERTKQTTEQLYKQVDGVWTEAESTVSASMKEKISAATEEVKGTFRTGSTDTSAKHDDDVRDGFKASSGEEKQKQTGSSDTAETFYGKLKSSISSPKFTLAFQKLKEAKVVDLAKKGYDIVKDELSGSPSKRKHLEYTPSPSWTGEKSTRTDLVVTPSKKSMWSKLKEKMQGYPVFKRITGISEPVVTKGQEIAEDVRERWETSDNPIVHKIQESFSLPDFVSEVQEAIRPVLSAYMKASLSFFEIDEIGDVETLKKYCSPEVIERCKAEHTAYQSHGIFFDNRILHVSEVEVRETKMMGSSPIIIVAFQTQQIYCVRDKHGTITEGGKDTIQTVYYAWAMQQVDAEELGEDVLYPIWKLREMQQLGVQALI